MAVRARFGGRRPCRLPADADPLFLLLLLLRKDPS
jgi:hypothetical protein